MKTVLSRREGPVAVITLNRPEVLNAFSGNQLPAIIDALKEAERDPAIGAVVLTGAGRGFSSGGDRASIGDLLQSSGPLDIARTQMAGADMVFAIRNSRLPVVAAVHGVAYGAGFALALACDLVVATRDARLCMVFSRLGISADMGAAWLLTQAVGPHRAKELILLADEISGLRGMELGIVNRLADSQEDMLSIATELATRLAAAAPEAMALSKNLINRSASVPLEDFFSLEQHASVITIGAAGKRLAVAASKP